MSAASNRISLRREMKLEERTEYGRDVYSLDGTPADAMLCALDKGIGLCTAMNVHPVLMVSGPNYGANLSIDCLYSGTLAAARTAAIRCVTAALSLYACRAYAYRKQTIFLSTYLSYAYSSVSDY